MYILIEDNPNCSPQERVFHELDSPQPVRQLRLPGPEGHLQWWDVVGVEDDGTFPSASAVQVEDSGAGNAWLIYGGAWGLRFRPEKSATPWSLQAPNQWGDHFKVLDISGDDIRFAP